MPPASIEPTRTATTTTRTAETAATARRSPRSASGGRFAVCRRLTAGAPAVSSSSGRPVLGGTAGVDPRPASACSSARASKTSAGTTGGGGGTAGGGDGGGATGGAATGGGSGSGWIGALTWDFGSPSALNGGSGGRRCEAASGSWATPSSARARRAASAMAARAFAVLSLSPGCRCLREGMILLPRRFPLHLITLRAKINAPRSGCRWPMSDRRSQSP